MRVLLVKLSSLGDVVHSFPALTDAAAAVPGIALDWLVDEDFAPLARLHPAVERVIALPLRRMKKSPRTAFRDFRLALGELRAVRYDAIIDAQGLMKSALAGLSARGGTRHGFSRMTAREGVAALTYGVGHSIPEIEHMATRIRRLFSASLGYPMPDTPASAGLDRVRASVPGSRRPYVLLIHGTSWRTKTWTVDGWRGLARLAAAEGHDAVLFAHGAREDARVAAIAEGLPSIERLPPTRLESLIPVVAGAEAVVTVDTGLGHLAAAFDLPTIGLYGPTNPGLTGLVGTRTRELTSSRPCAPCEKTTCAIAPDFGEGPPCLADHKALAVWKALQELVRQSDGST